MMGYGPHWGMMSYGPKWGMMSGLGGPIWAAPFSMITWPLLLVAATAGAVWLLRSSPRIASHAQRVAHLVRPPDERHSAVQSLRTARCRGKEAK